LRGFSARHKTKLQLITRNKKYKMNIELNLKAENHRKTPVTSSAYIDLAKFINKSHERRFNDALMKLVIV
jgi:hypothetical protein